MNDPAYPAPISSVDDLPKNYDAAEAEARWQAYWAACGVYKFEPHIAVAGTESGATRLRTRDEIFAVDTPPPTVSGALHIGHVYSYTQTDMSVRYQRMRGKHIFYPFGFDDNGLPTERLVEKERGIRAHEVSREQFIQMCVEVSAKYEAEFIALWKSLAISCDWEQFYTTIDERSRAISQASFIDLYNKGYVYRKVAPTQWDWVNQTAIAQAEIEDREVPGHFHYIKFQWADGPGQPVRGELVIGTTRPELIPACVAVMVNPESSDFVHDHEGQPVLDAQGNKVRQADLIGKIAVTPLFEVEVPILPSEKADPAKGTGILMCCTFGDQEDVEHWERFNLPTRVIIGKDGRIHNELDDLYYDVLNESPDPGEMQEWPSRNVEKAVECSTVIGGNKINKARELIRQELQDSNLLLHLESITHTVRFAERGDVPVEILVTPQWYVNLLDHKIALIEQGRKVRWYPSYMLKRYEQWVNGLNTDWCISRQRYNGVPFPVWHTAFGSPIVATIDQLPVNPLIEGPSLQAVRNTIDFHETGHTVAEADLDLLKRYAGFLEHGTYPGTSHEFESQSLAATLDSIIEDQTTPKPDRDVMDTWATSSVTPLLNTHLMPGSGELSARHTQLFPFDMRPQAHDIIRTWAFYTIAKAYFHFGTIPWTDIVISGHAQDASRQKMSKSKGNVVTPAEMVGKYSADGLRYWSGSVKLGTDTLYDETKLGEGRKLINKLFNATKFALRHLLDYNPATATITYPTDLWLISRLNATIERATRANDAFEFGDAKQAAEDVFWADLCDNYLEIAKGRLYGEPLAVDAHPDLTPEQLRTSTQATLYIALSSVLRMFAPVLPHITEECWSWYFAQFSDRRSIHEEEWPTEIEEVTGQGSRVKEESDLLLATVGAVRKWKSEQSVSVKKPLRLVQIYRTENAPRAADGLHTLDGAHLHAVLGDLLSTCNAAEAYMVNGDPPSGAVMVERSPVAVVCELAPEEGS